MQGGDFTHACNGETPASRRNWGKEYMKSNKKKMTCIDKLLANTTNLESSYQFFCVVRLWKFQCQLKIIQS